MALQIKLRYPIIRIFQIAGILTIWLAASKPPPRPNRRPVLADWSMRGLILIGLILLAG